MPGHAVPHAPQLLGSILVSIQLLPQRMNGALHWKSQLPLAQTDLPFAGALHTFPQLPQLDVALEVSTHEPSQLVSAPQSAPQLPEMQTIPLSHFLVQVPQWSEAELRSTHFPSHSV